MPDKKRLHIPEAEELPGDPGAVWRSWARPEEVDTFDEFVRRFWKGELSPEEFRQFRLQQGVYGQAQEGLQMIRVKIPAGGLNADQLAALADLAATTPRRCAHVTTRQNFQFHFVRLEDATGWLEKINAVGLTTREACSNTVRTITGCHKAGVCPTEPFDVSPYAAAATRFFLRNPMNQALPRKFKISFSGCPQDCALPVLHDVGAVAALKEGRKGFQLFLGGGLGAQPRAARLLEEFTTEEALIPTLAAVVRVFDRVGEREKKSMARMKFAVDKLGWEPFRELVLKERAKLELALRGQFPAVEGWTEAPGPASAENPRAPEDAAYARWRKTNVLAQKQPGYALVHVRLPLGDITAEQMKTAAEAVRRFSNGTLRTTAQQNLALRWVPEARLPELYAVLEPAGLARSGAERLVDVTSCPGADTCQIGITSSRGMARALGEHLEAAGARHADLPVRIKISGCPNSCGQHHIADIGLFGGARKFDDKTVPTYQMMLAGALGAMAPAPFAKAFMKVPASRVTEAVERLLSSYEKERFSDEAFRAWVERVGLESLRGRLADLSELPPFAEAPELYRDTATKLEEVGGRRERFELKAGHGDCAA